jgi:hypothetical protein
MSTIADLITIVREDYLDDAVTPYSWSDSFLLRTFLEAERQACNRANLIYDDSTAAYAQIALKNGVSTYTINAKVNVLEHVGLNGVELVKKSKSELDYRNPTWRAQAGLKNKTVQYSMRGRDLRIIPTPDASVDATFVETSAPISGMVANDTWWDSANSQLYKYSGGVWTLDANATLGTLQLETYRQPAADTILTTYTPEIPSESHHDLIYWVLHEAFSKPDMDQFDPGRAALYLATFNQKFGNPVPHDVRAHQFEEDRYLSILPANYSFNLTASSDDDWDS